MPTKDDKKQIEEQSQWALDKEREFIPAEWRPLSEAAALRVWQCQRAGRGGGPRAGGHWQRPCVMPASLTEAGQARASGLSVRGLKFPVHCQ